MKITCLKTENVKRVKAIEIHPDGEPVIVVGGKNAQGKSSILDSIEYAMGGKPKTSRPIRDGEDKASIVLETEELRVLRKFTEKGTSLTVEDKDGGKHKSPQAILDKLYSALSFDPMDFSRKSAKDQADTLKSLVGIDLTPLDEERKQAFEERTDVNREIKSLEAQLVALSADEVEPVSVSELSAELNEAYDTNRAIDNHRRNVEDKTACIKATCARRDEISKRIEELTQELDDCQQDIERHKDELQSLENAPEQEPVDVEAIRDRIRDAETINAKAVECKKRRDIQEDLANKKNDAAHLTKKIENIDEEKRLTLEEAKFPVDGLSFDENGVSLNGVPFEQCSSAERLRVSVSIGLALNPEFRVLLVRDGSLLDSDGLQMIAKMAEEADAQVWVEKVSDTGEGCTVVIEDGVVMEAREAVTA